MPGVAGKPCPDTTALLPPTPLGALVFQVQEEEKGSRVAGVRKDSVRAQPADPSVPELSP